MSDQALLNKSNVADIFGQAWSSGRLTYSARQQLQAAFLNGVLSEDECAAIDRLFHAVRRGWLKIID